MRPCPLHWAHELPDDDLRAALAGVGLAPRVVDGLVADRRTAGAEARIEAELGPLPELVEAGLIPATSTNPALCMCGNDPEPPEREEPEWLPEPPPAPEVPEPDPDPEDRYDDAAEAAAADAAEMGW